MDGPSSRARRILAPLLALIGALLIGAAGLLPYLDRNLFDADRFAARAANALSEPEVRDAVAARLTERIVEAEPDLIGGAPLIESASGAIIGTEAFRRLFAGAVADLHRTTFSGDRSTLVLKVSDAGVLIVEALDAVAPRVAAQIPTGLETRLAAFSSGEEALLVGVARFGEKTRWLWIASLALGLLALAGAIAASADRRRAIPRVALVLAGVGALGVVGYGVAQLLVGGLGNASDATALRSAFGSFFGGIRTWSLAIVAIGLVTAAAGYELVRPLDARLALTAAWRRLSTTPAATLPRASRAAAMVAAGVLIVVFPDSALRLVALFAGGVLLYAGAAELLRLIAPPPAPEDAPRERTRLTWRRPAVAVAALALCAGVVGLALGPGSDELPVSAAGEADSCNGSPELCDRTIDELTFPGTHNSFSAADRPNWFFAQQEKGLTAQLDSGIRALLIDTHYGVDTGRGVFTVLEPGSTSREKIEAPLGERFVDTAKRLRERINPGATLDGADRELYFCHAFCELGAQPTIEGMREIRDFLVANPNEVVLLSVESDVSLEANADAFRRSGLLDLVWKGPFRGGELPTLREMIDADQRAAVLLWQRGPLGEAGFGDLPWMHRQFGVLQETPYEDLTTAADLESPESCAPNEGRDTNPLFLINNWVETSPVFLPSNAREVNAYDTLLRRVLRCERIRDLRANILAVDFFEEGDVVGVARTLNGLPRGG